jgi:hypothetical protein
MSIKRFPLALSVKSILISLPLFHVAALYNVKKENICGISMFLMRNSLLLYSNIDLSWMKNDILCISRADYIN